MILKLKEKFVELFKDDETIASIGLEEPMVISFAKKLIKKGINISLDEVKNEASLALLIKKGREVL